MPSSFRNRLTRRQAAPSSSSSSSSTLAVPATSSTGIGNASFLGRRYNNIGSGGGSNNKQKQQQQRNTQQNHHHTTSSTNPLATFDACIEACDALAASSGSSSSSSSPWHIQDATSRISNTTTNSTTQAGKDSSNEKHDQDDNENNPSSNEKKLDGMIDIIHNETTGCSTTTTTTTTTTTSTRTEIQNKDNHDVASMMMIAVPDCSVLVSPDGALLFTSSSSSSSLPTLANQNQHHKNNDDNDDDDDNEEFTIRRWWTNITPENYNNDDDVGAILHSEDYESAVISGYDLTPHGDYDINGFTSTGWDIDATSCALSASRDVLVRMTNFVETLATCRKQEAVCVRTAVEMILGDVRMKILEQQQQQQQRGWRRRMGPMIISSETKLAAAIEAMEEYYVQISEGEMERWKLACSSSSSYTRKATSSSVEPCNNEWTCDAEGGVTSDTTTTQRWNPPPGWIIHGMLPKLQSASMKATTRTSERERALSEMRAKMSECETILREQKVWASSQWKRVAEEESNIDRLYAIKKMEQNEFYENQRRKRLQEKDGGGEEADEETGDRIEGEGPLSKEVWEMVQNVNTSMEDFGHTGYSPRAVTRKANTSHRQHHNQQQQLLHQEQIDIPSKSITRADVERESEIQDLKMVAHAADEAVEDAAGKLLNIMSKGDTTLRSARLAAESCLLSECNAARNCLRSLVAMERESLRDRLLQLDKLEAAVNAIDVRKDIDTYIRADKAIPGGRSREGEDDGGGIAAALAVLNSHGESNGNATSARKYRNIERPSYFEGWVENEGGDDDGGDEDVEPEIFGEVVNMIFSDCPHPASVADDDEFIDSGSRERQITPNDSKIEISANALRSKQGSNYRKSILYELNNQRSKKTWVEDRSKFDALCGLFDAFLSGCGREPSDVSNAMMLMILSQTFYIVDDAREEENNHGKESDDGSTTRDRHSRIYVKSRICHHEIWSDEDFWDQALYQCVSESLSKSGVLLNYVKSASDNGNGISGRQPRTVKWHDLSPDEYAGAATQVHSVLFAQLGTLSHSMLELGCGIPRACNFVRRLSVRYQLPLSLRVTLMQHLTKERK